MRDIHAQTHDGYRATRSMRIASDVVGGPLTVAVCTDRRDPITLRPLVPIELTLATRLLGTLHLRGKGPLRRVTPVVSGTVRTVGTVPRRRRGPLPRIMRRCVIRRGLARPRSRSRGLMVRNRASRRPIHRAMRRRRIRMPMLGEAARIRPVLHGRRSFRVRTHRSRCRPRMFYRTRRRAVDPWRGRTRSTPVVVVGRIRLRCPIIRKRSGRARFGLPGRMHGLVRARSIMQRCARCRFACVWCAEMLRRAVGQGRSVKRRVDRVRLLSRCRRTVTRLVWRYRRIGFGCARGQPRLGRPIPRLHRFRWIVLRCNNFRFREIVRLGESRIIEMREIRVVNRFTHGDRYLISVTVENELPWPYSIDRVAGDASGREDLSFLMSACETVLR